MEMILSGKDTTAPEETKEASPVREEPVVKPKKKQELKLIHFVGEIQIAPKVTYFT